MIQSLGQRGINKFRKTLNDNYENFRLFILEPFGKKFDLSDWFKRIGNFKQFGIGIATIYLNRVNKDIYPIMNKKTIAALQKLGYNISTTTNFTNYKIVKKIQTELIKEFPILENFYITDALNHFIIAVYKEQWLINCHIQVNSFEDNLEQNEIEQLLSFDITDVDKHELLEQIKKCEKENTEFIIIKGKRVKRCNYLMVKIKEYRGYKCQFCSHEIPKEKGGYYIEACHIKAKCDGGKDTLENILVLCPNCHKLFDNWTHEKEKQTEKEYKVILNGKEYKAKIK